MIRSASWKGLPTVIIGSSGNSKEIAFIIEDINTNSNNEVIDLLGFVEKEEESVGREILKYKVVACDSNLKDFASKYAVLGVILPNGFPEVKKRIFENTLKDINNIVFPNITHPSVTFQKDTVDIGYGNIFTAGVRLTGNIIIGCFNLFNQNTTIAHDVQIGDFCVINPLTSISGGVKIEDVVLIGTGSSILQNLEIETNSIVGAGAVVTKNVQKNTTVAGVPAKPLKGESL